MIGESDAAAKCSGLDTVPEGAHFGASPFEFRDGVLELTRQCRVEGLRRAELLPVSGTGGAAFVLFVELLALPQGAQRGMAGVVTVGGRASASRSGTGVAGAARVSTWGGAVRLRHSRLLRWPSGTS
ncbi:hypothetical protein AD006_04545 [Pseudonocardia sp. EC080610-09]|nr:hypothetical protein AD006_04545 [Pseudonocardia sp. EC080610-09]ALL81780.1 hypothetical protein AD017_12365 [Pseudonocardia sp. EC080619-01]